MYSSSYRSVPLAFSSFPLPILVPPLCSWPSTMLGVGAWFVGPSSLLPLSSTGALVASKRKALSLFPHLQFSGLSQALWSPALLCSSPAKLLDSAATPSDGVDSDEFLVVSKEIERMMKVWCPESFYQAMARSRQPPLSPLVLDLRSTPPVSAAMVAMVCFPVKCGSGSGREWLCIWWMAGLCPDLIFWKLVWFGLRPSRFPDLTLWIPRIVGVLGFSPELVPVVYCIFTGVGSSCCVFSVFLSAGVGSGLLLDYSQCLVACFVVPHGRSLGWCLSSTPRGVFFIVPSGAFKPLTLVSTQDNSRWAPYHDDPILGVYIITVSVVVFLTLTTFHHIV